MRESDTRRRILIGVGDVNGIGSEIVLKCMKKEIYEKILPILLGHVEHLNITANMMNVSCSFKSIKDVRDAVGSCETIEVLEYGDFKRSEFEWGKVSKMAGLLALDQFRKAMELAQKGLIDAFVYAPQNKTNMKLAGMKHESDYTYMNELVSGNGINALLIGKHSIVTRVTMHVPLKEVAQHITKENVLRTIEMSNEGLRRLGLNHPRIGVAALNPHMGEGGLCGQEEIESIIPAIEIAKQKGINIVGLYPADSLYQGFYQNFPDGKLDMAVYMYHDIAGLTSKMLESGYEGGMFTLVAGLPVPVLTVGHGTAYQIAGKARANETSLMNALLFVGNV